MATATLPLIPLTDLTFTQLILRTENPSEESLVLFGAAWCGPCTQVKPNVEAVAAKYPNTVKAYFYDVDAHYQRAADFSVRGIPTILAFRNKQLIGSLTGFRTIAQLEELINSQPATV